MKASTDTLLVCFGLVMVAAAMWFVVSLFDLAAAVMRHPI